MSLFKHILVVGAGGWGTAYAGALAQSGRRVTLWGRSAGYVEELQRTRENYRYLPGILIPASVKLTAQIPTDADVTVLVIPTQHLRSTLGGLKDRLNATRPVVSLSKGIEQESLKRPSEIIAEVTGARRIAVLSGPSHAEEVGRGLPTTLVLASEEAVLPSELVPALATEMIRIYTSEDVRGVEFAGALKNVIAIAAGISDGLGLGDNAKASLLARGIVEMSRLAEALGAKRGTLFGISGLGDMITTCISRHGRNLAVGRGIGNGRTLEEILAKTKQVAEGVWTSRAARSLAKQHGVEAPIIDVVCRVLFEKLPPMEAVRELMTRGAKSETRDLI